MSKGGSNTSSTQVPAWLESAAIENINKGRDVSQIGYTPYYGPDVAAFNPMQQQSMQSTGNAASAFGLAPQGFDAMAGMPEAQTFAGGVQGYSSAPLYEQALSQLQENRPAQYDAINSMFIDPVTGALPTGNYSASPEQVQQMFDRSPTGQPNYDLSINNTAGGGDAGGSTGEYYGVNEQYNPLGYSNPTEDISGDGVIDYRDMSFGEAGRRDIGFGENVGNFIKSATGISAIEKAMDYGQGLADGFTPSPSNGLLSQTSGAMDPADARKTMNEAAARYEARISQDRDFGNAVRPTEEVVSAAEVTPYPESNITGGPDASYDLMSNVSAPAAAPIDVNAEYELQTRLRDEEVRNEKAAAAKVISDRVAATKARYAKEKAAKDLATKQAKTKAAAKKAAAATAAANKRNKGNNKSTPTKATNTQWGDSSGNVIKSSNGNAVKTGSAKKSGGGSGGGGGSSSGGGGGGTYCCTKMRENGKWTSNRRVYKMHKWHFEQPQWWRDGYDVWGKVIAETILSRNGDYSAAMMDDFYDHRVNGGKITVKSALTHALMYPAVFAIGMAAKVTGKHITKVTITS